MGILEVLIVILVVMWIAGGGVPHIGYSEYNGGGIIHVLLIIALVVIVIRLLRGRKVL